MRLPISLPAAPLCGALVAAALAAAGAPAAHAAPYATGDFKGTTSQGGPMIMRIDAGRIERYGFAVKVTCKRGKRVHKETGRFTTRRAVRIAADGTFKAKRKSGRFRPQISGRVTGEKASGSFRLTMVRSGGERCKSKLVTWSAAPVDSHPPTP